MDSAALLDLLGNENRRRLLRLLARRPCYVTEISDALDVSPKAVIGHLRKLEDAGVIECRVNDQRRKYFRIARTLRLEVTVSPYGFGTKSAYSASPNLDLTACRHLSVDTEIDHAHKGGEDDANGPTENARMEDARSVTATAGDGSGATRQPGADETTGSERSLDRSKTTAESDDRDNDGAAGLARDLHRLEQLERELSLAQRWVQGRRTAVMDRLTGQVEERTATTEGFAVDSDARLWAELLSAIAADASTPEAMAERVSVPRAVVEEALDAMERRGFVQRTADGWEIGT